MGTLNGSDFRTELTYMLLNRSDTGFTIARRNRWVDQSYIHVSHPSVHRHRELETSFVYTLATGDNTLDMDNATLSFVPTHLWSVFWSDADPTTTPTATKAKIHPRGIHVHDKRILNTGRPTEYAIEGTTLHLLQVPSATENGQFVTARFTREPAALTDSTTTVLPRFWDEVILLGAKWRAERDLGYRELAELTKQDYAALINEFQSRYELEAEDTGWEVELVRQSV
jgi:hypothetical protein